MIKVAVIGSGNALTEHVEAWSNIPEVRITGVVDLGKKQNHQFSLELITTTRNLWSIKPDVVDICTVLRERTTYIKEAANHSAHVICDIPFAESVEEMNDILQVCKENKVYLIPGNTLHFSPEYVNALNQMKNHSIGKPGVIRMVHQKTKPMENMDVFTALGIHQFDWILEAFGPVKRLMAKRICHQNEEAAVEYAVINLRMEVGAIAHIELSWTHQHPKVSFELTGNKGMIKYDSTASNPIQISSRAKDDKPVESISGKSVIQRQAEHFVTCLLKDERPIVTGENILKAMQIVEAAQISVETEAPVLIKRGDSS